MNHLQSLESRTLLSATAALTDATADLAELKGELKAYAVTYRADAVAVSAATRSLPKTAANRTMLSTLRRDYVRSAVAVTVAGAKLQAAGRASTGRARADFVAVFRDDSDAAAAGRLAADLEGLQKALAGPTGSLTAAATAGRTKVATDLSALVAANPDDAALRTAATAASAHSSASATAVHTTVVKLGTDLAIAIADLKATAQHG